MFFTPPDSRQGLTQIGTFFGYNLFIETSDTEEAKKIEEQFDRVMAEQFTTKRKFYAWVGFCTLVALVLGFIAFIVWANLFINANLQ